LHEGIQPSLGPFQHPEVWGVRLRGDVT
jgi:hypothetical protein